MIYFGWWVVAGSFVYIFFTFAMLTFGFPAFYSELATEFGWSRGAVTGFGGVSGLALAFLSPSIGIFIDRGRHKQLLLTGAALLGVGLFGLSQIGTLGGYYLYSIITAAGMAIAAPSPMHFALLGKWFGRSYSLATGLMVGSMSLGGIMLPPAISFMIDSFGWRVALIVMSMACLVVPISVTLTLLSRKPSLSDAEQVPRPGAELLRSPGSGNTGSGGWSREVIVKFAGVAVAKFLTMAMVGFVLHQLMIHLRDIGFSRYDAAQAISILIFAGLLSKLVFGVLADRVNSIWLAALASLLATIAVMPLFEARAQVMVYGVVAIFGLGYGGLMMLPEIVIGRLVPHTVRGKAIGVLGVFNGLGGAFGATASGSSFDFLGSYAVTSAVAATFGLASVLALLVPYFVFKPHYRNV